MIAPGTIVSREQTWPWEHYGIVSDRRIGHAPMVLNGSAQRGFVSEDPWEEFAAGCPVILHGYPSALPPEIVIARGRSQLGRPWDALTFNCEHFVCFAHALEESSPQLQKAVLVCLAPVLFAALSG
jgi:hypothetical protein